MLSSLTGPMTLSTTLETGFQLVSFILTTVLTPVKNTKTLVTLSAKAAHIIAYAPKRFVIGSIGNDFFVQNKLVNLISILELSDFSHT